MTIFNSMCKKPTLLLKISHAQGTFQLASWHPVGEGLIMMSNLVAVPLSCAGHASRAAGVHAMSPHQPLVMSRCLAASDAWPSWQLPAAQLYPLPPTTPEQLGNRHSVTQQSSPWASCMSIAIISRSSAHVKMDMCGHWTDTAACSPWQHS